MLIRIGKKRIEWHPLCGFTCQGAVEYASKAMDESWLVANRHGAKWLCQPALTKLIATLEHHRSQYKSVGETSI